MKITVACVVFISFVFLFSQNITRKAMESIYNISAMRNRFLRVSVHEDNILMEAYPVSILLAKVNPLKVEEQVFRVSGDEIHFPGQLFAGEWSVALHNSSVQVGAKGAAKNVLMKKCT